MPSTRIVQLQLYHRRVEIVQDRTSDLWHPACQAMYALIDLHRALTHDHFDASVGHAIGDRKLISSHAPFPIRRDKLTPRRRVHAPASDDIFPPRKSLFCPRVKMSEQGRPATEEDGRTPVDKKTRLEPVGRRWSREKKGAHRRHPTRGKKPERDISRASRIAHDVITRPSGASRQPSPFHPGRS